MRHIQADTGASHAWEHWGWIWSVVFLGTLLLPMVQFLREQVQTRGSWLSATVLGAALLGLAVLMIHLVGFWGLPRWGTHLRARARNGMLYIAALALATFGLLEIHPIFSFLLIGFFTQVFYALPTRLAILTATVANVLLGFYTIQEPSFAGVLSNPIFWLWLLGGGCGSLIALWLSAIIDQSAERQALIDELHRAQRDLARVERESGVLQERQRLAREIHDTLAQGLISIITHLEAADQALDHNPNVLRHHLAQAQAAARDNLGEARRVVRDLRPEVLDNGTLPDAMRRVVAAWAKSSGMVAASYITGTPRPLPPEYELTLLRVAQEALANVAKHAHAQTVAVTLSYMPDRVLLDVQDDGEGLQKASTVPLHSAGFGLHSMRGRVTELGGSLQLESEPGEGTTLVVEVPTATQQPFAATIDP